MAHIADLPQSERQALAEKRFGSPQNAPTSRNAAPEFRVSKERVSAAWRSRSWIFNTAGNHGCGDLGSTQDLLLALHSSVDVRAGWLAL